jgi:hypothetical protein
VALRTRAHSLCASLLLAACSSDPSADDAHSTTNPGESDSDDATNDTTNDTTADSTGEEQPSLVIVVVATSPHPEPNKPAVNAVVALDTANGRFETTTDAEGRAYFEGFEWSGETVDVTIGAIDHVLTSRLDLAESDTNPTGELEFEIQALGVPDNTVEVSGSVLAKEADWHDVIASIGGPEGFWDSALEWSTGIAPDQPFTVVALEVDFLDGGPNTVDNPIFGWFTLEHPGVSEDTQIDIDFAMPTAPDFAVGSYGVPERPDSPLHVTNFGFVYTMAQTTGQMIGRASATSMTDDGNTVDYEIEYVTPATVPDPQTCFRVVSQVGPYISTTCVPGFPGAGPQDVELLDVTEIPFVADRSLYDPVEFEVYDADVVPELHITQAADLVWLVIGPEDATSLTVPQPPTGFEGGSATLEVSLWLRRPAVDGDSNESWAIIAPFSAVT